MTETRTFSTEPSVRTYSFQGVDVELELWPGVFPPSPMAGTYAELFRVKPGERLMDVGTGAGLFAILAARLGARVSATDVAAEAVELTLANAERNGVEVEARQGAFFGEFEGPFDVVVANLPQGVVPLATREGLGKSLARTITGGERGDELVLELLEQSRHRLQPGGRLYVSIDTEAEYRRTLARALDGYEAKLLAFRTAPLPDYFEEHREWYLDLVRQGRLSVFEEDGRWYCHQLFFELTTR